MKSKTLFLKIIVYAIGIAVLALCIWLPWAASMDPELAFLRSSILIGLYAAAVPFFIALVQVLRLLGYIDGNRAFSDLSLKALKIIKYCAAAVAILCVAALPFLYSLAQSYDAPGILLIGCITAFPAIVIAAFAAVFHMLFQNAAGQKSEK